MTNQEIMNLADKYMDGDLNIRSVFNNDLIAFAKAIELCVLDQEAANWYRQGAEDERRACAAICDAEMDEWDDSNVNATNLALLNVADAIRARGE